MNEPSEEQHHHFIRIIALFGAMEEESTHLTGTMKHEKARVFNEWRKQTIKLVKHIEKGSDMDYLDELKDRIHEAIKEI